MALARLAGLTAPLLRSRSMAGVDPRPVCVGGVETILLNPDGDGRNYRLHVFNAGSTLSVARTGLAEVLIVGGGATSFGGAASPGNGGRVVTGRHFLPAGSHAVTVGAAGEPSTIGSVLNSGPSKTSLDTNNPTGAGGIIGSLQLGLVSRITGAAVTYGSVTASPVANRGDGNLNGVGSSGFVAVRYEI